MAVIQRPEPENPCAKPPSEAKASCRTYYEKTDAFGGMRRIGATPIIPKFLPCTYSRFALQETGGRRFFDGLNKFLILLASPRGFEPLLPP